VSSVTGLGSGYFSERGWLSRGIRALYRAALAGRTFAVFQNGDDLARLVDAGIATPDRCALIAGSGVDTIALAPDPRVLTAERKEFLMVSRMLWSKGVRDFVDAARRVKARHPDMRFLLFGGSREDYGSKNPDFVPRAWLEAQSREGIVEWRGWTPPEEVERSMRRCAAVVHPSYYPEGVPRTLIEAAAAGAPIVTTDTPGCRDAVLPGVSGLLCPPRSPGALAAAMDRLAADPGLRASMGREGRRLAVARFDQRIVLDRLLEVYAEAPARTGG
jgi:glycosyltransferase involved in cell wall biosynthesis